MEDRLFGDGGWGRTQIFVAAVIVMLTGLLLSWISGLSIFRGRSRLPPGPKGWPIVGALPHLAKAQLPHKAFYELFKEYGPIIFMRLGSVPALVISNEAMAKEVYQTNDLNFASKPLLPVAQYFGYGEQGIAFAAYGPRWRQARKISTAQLLTTSRLARFKCVFEQEILNTVHAMLKHSTSNGKEDVNVNISSMIHGAMMNIVTQIMWNKRHRDLDGSQSHDDEKLGGMIKKISGLGGINSVAFFPFKFLTIRLSGFERKASGLHRDFDQFLETIICEKERDLSTKTNAEADEDDFVTVLLKLRAQSGDAQGLSRENMKAILTDIILGGTDTSSVVLDWTFTELMRHPHIMRKVQDELTTVVGEHRLVSESDIPRLKYLNLVLKEVLRKHPPAPMGFPRLSMADCKVGGYDVPANTWVFINQFAIHHDSVAWENPWEFNPDRFLQSELDHGKQNFDYVPFGGGRRMCPGMNFALTVLHIALAQFLHTINWSLPDGQNPQNVDFSEAYGLALMRAKPLLLNAKPRLTHPVIYPAMG